MFASRTLIEHAARGLAGFGATALAIALAGRPGLMAVTASLALAAVAMIAFRGCPVCWTIGAFETARRYLLFRNT